jgi:hypothetical protein
MFWFLAQNEMVHIFDISGPRENKIPKRAVTHRLESG